MKLAVRWVAIVWVALALPLVGASLPDVNQDARLLVVLAASTAVASTMLAIWSAHTDHVRRSGWYLVIGGAAMPTFAFVWINLVPIAIGLIVAAGFRNSGSSRSA